MSVKKASSWAEWPEAAATAALPPSQTGHPLLEGRNRRVAQARIDVARRLEVEECRRVIHVVEDIRRRLEDRDVAGAGRRIRGGAGVDRARLDAIGAGSGGRGHGHLSGVACWRLLARVLRVGIRPVSFRPLHGAANADIPNARILRAATEPAEPASSIGNGGGASGRHRPPCLYAGPSPIPVSPLPSDQSPKCFAYSSSRSASASSSKAPKAPTSHLPPSDTPEPPPPVPPVRRSSSVKPRCSSARRTMCQPCCMPCPCRRRRDGAIPSTRPG